MKAHTEYLTFHTQKRRELVRITDRVASAVAASGIAEGMVLVSAMHITAGVFVNDDEPGLHRDIEAWVQAGARRHAAPDGAKEGSASRRGPRPTTRRRARATSTITRARTTATRTSRTSSSATRSSCP